MGPLDLSATKISPKCRVKQFWVWMTKVRFRYNWVTPNSTSLISPLRLIKHRPTSRQLTWGLDSILRPRSEGPTMVCKVGQWKVYILNHLDTRSRDLILMRNSTKRMRSWQRWFYHKSSLESLTILIKQTILLKSTKQLRKCWFLEKSKESWSNLNQSKVKLSTSICMGKI